MGGPDVEGCSVSRGDQPGAPQPPSFGPLERQVLQVLWERGSATVRDVIAALPSEPAYTTIATVLANLGRKGMVASSRQGRSTYFRALMSQDMLAAQQMGHLLQTSNDRAASMLHFVDSMAEGDLELLRDYLRRRSGETS